jgi:hypothetical protein
VLRLIDLLAVAIEDMRQGGDPRLPLELALVKVTRPQADLQRESLAHRVELLEARLSGNSLPAPPPAELPPAGRADAPAAPPQPKGHEPNGHEPNGHENAINGGGNTGGGSSSSSGDAPPLHLAQLQEAWQRSVLPAVQERSIPVATLLGEARPAALEGETLVLEFASVADFHRRQVEDPKNLAHVHAALYAVTGHKLAITTTLAAEAGGDADSEERPLEEGDFISLLKDKFDAEEVEEP